MPRTVTTADYERWKSTIDGEVWIKQFDRRGEIISVRVQGGREFRVLPEERKMYQEDVLEVKNDPFQNGMLIPLQLVEGASDYEELKDNPNHITEGDMRSLLENPKALDALKAGVARVSNPTTLVRLLTIAETDPELDTTLKQLQVIRARLQQVQQADEYEEVETIGVGQTSDGRDVVMTQAPLSPSPPNPEVGRRGRRDDLNRDGTFRPRDRDDFDPVIVRK